MKYCFIVALAVCVSAGAEDISPRIGSIEIYGVRKVSLEKVRSAIGAKTGDPMPAREAVEDRIDKIPGVLASRVEAVCCVQNTTVLYVGIEEKNEPHFEFRPAPTGEMTVPAELADKYHAFLNEVAASIRGKNADEDLTNGYSLMADPECRELQEAFLPLVSHDLDLIDRVVRGSADPEQRTMAAYLLQYAPRTPRAIKTMVDSLQYALQDQEDTVREAAIESLRAVAVGARLHPDQQIRIEPTWFIELMNSVVWSDRRNASLALVDLTDKGDPDTLDLLRDRALAAVLEMARWHDLDQALPAFILAGRLAGLDEKAIQDAWVSGDREAVLRLAANSKKHSRSANKSAG